jgi:hypothetical protein
LAISRELEAAIQLTLDRAKKELAIARGVITVTPRFLLADMALFGLLDEVEDSSAVAEYLLDTDFAHRAAPHARIAYEAAQQALILATEADYSSAGARVVIYFRKKDRNLMRRVNGGVPESIMKADAWYEDRLLSLRKLWELHWPDAGMVFEEARRVVDKLPRKPGNWMGEDPAQVLESRYALLASALGNPAPLRVTAVTTDAYSALSRSSHLAPEFPELLLKTKAGELAFRALKRDRTAGRSAVVAGITAAAGEAMLAAAYRASAT